MTEQHLQTFFSKEKQPNQLIIIIIFVFVAKVIFTNYIPED